MFAILPSQMALATNGYFSHGYGTKAKGIGGAGVAFPQDSLASATNPAGMVQVGDRLDAGGAYFAPNREYETTNGFVATPSQESGSKSFLIPHFGYNMRLDPDSSVGVAVYGNGGMNTDYADPVFGSGEAGVNFEQLFVNVSYAMNLDSLALGVSGILAYQTFEAKGIENFAGFSADSTKLTDNGEDTSTGFGLRLGVSMEVAEGITVGAAYQPVMDMSPFDSYAGLFAEQGDFDIPSNYAVGAAWKSGQLAVAFDYMVINYTDVASVSNSVNSILTGSLLGDSDGPGFGWEDITVIKIGAAYTLSDAWTIRGGINHGDNPIPEGETLFNILAPGVVEDHITAGFTWTLSPDSELNFAFMHAFEGSTTGDHPAGLGGGTTTITMDQNEFELSYGLKL